MAERANQLYYPEGYHASFGYEPFTVSSYGQGASYNQMNRDNTTEAEFCDNLSQS